MILAVLLFQVATATPAPVPAKPTPAPSPTAISRGPRSLSDFARQRRASGTTSKGTFSAAQSTAPRANTEQSGYVSNLTQEQAKAAAEAQARMDRAVKDGLWTEQNIKVTEPLKEAARREWDAAAENCRRTPGCKPAARDDGVTKHLKTDDELMDDVAKSRGMTRNKSNPNETGTRPN